MAVKVVSIPCLYKGCRGRMKAARGSETAHQLVCGTCKCYWYKFGAITCCCFTEKGRDDSKVAKKAATALLQLAYGSVDPGEWRDIERYEKKRKKEDES